MTHVTVAPQLRPRPAHIQGTTRCAYTSNGSQLVTAGSNNTIRLYKTGYDGEPTNIDDCQEQNLALASGSDFFIVGSEDGTVSLYSIHSASFERILLRTTLPVRDVALSSDRKWCAIASDELSVKLVHVEDITRVRHLREHNRPARHVSFDPKDTLAAVSCSDGIIYMYSLTSDVPELIRKIQGVIGAIDGESEASTKAIWHPDGRAFAVATLTRNIQIITKNDWEKQRCFANGHNAEITTIAWCPNGALLASAAKDGKILIWETKTQSVIQRYDYPNVIDLTWHPSENILSFSTTNGEVYIYPDPLGNQYAPMLKWKKQPAPLIHDPLLENGGRKNLGQQAWGPFDHQSRQRRESLGSLDSFFEKEGYQDEDDFIDDDDGAGCTVSGGFKRLREDDEVSEEHVRKRRELMKPQQHEAFQPGATPWRGDRKYLCLNLIGFVWTIDQGSHHTVTVEFYDYEFQRNFHFTDTFLYDKACLNGHGTLFSCPPLDDRPAFVFYRPHETWTQRLDWRTPLPNGEAVTAMSLSDSFITIMTDKDYVRIFTLFGLPYRVYRPKNSPMVTCASWRDYVMTVGNGPMGANGSTRLLYTIENIRDGEVCQNEDTVALPEGATLAGVFFSDQGEPCIYDSTGTLLTLLSWRRPSRASWVPLLDTKLLPRLASGRRQETYFPIAVADNKFHCIILKGGDRYPYFPGPLLSDFEFSVPLSSPSELGKEKNGKKIAAQADEKQDDEDGLAEQEVGGVEETESRKLEQQFLLQGIYMAQLRDILRSSNGSQTHRSSLSKVERDIDKTLLQMMVHECRQGDERGMRVLEMAKLTHDKSGRIMEAAMKVAERFGRTILREKIRGMGEKRLAGREDDDEQ